MLKHWFIQSTSLRLTGPTTDSGNRLLKGLCEADVHFTDFGVIPFTTEITNWDSMPVYPAVFPYASTKILKMLTEEDHPLDKVFVGCPPDRAKALWSSMQRGVFYDKVAFDMEAYMGPLKDIMLNGYGGAYRIVRLDHVLHHKFAGDTFVKPTRDLKLFAGTVIPSGTSLDEHLKTTTCDEEAIASNLDASIFLSPAFVPTAILEEYRIFIVEGKAVTGSLYKRKGRVEYSSKVPPGVLNAAEEYASIYSPARAFTIDLAAVDYSSHYKVVEFNSINCSGLYHSDVGALAKALREIQ